MKLVDEHGLKPPSSEGDLYQVVGKVQRDVSLIQQLLAKLVCFLNLGQILIGKCLYVLNTEFEKSLLHRHIEIKNRRLVVVNE